MGSCAELESFALQVLGDSMEPEFSDGEVIIIEPSRIAEDGCYVVAEYEQEYIFRCLVKNGDKWHLEPLNRKYPTINIDGIPKIKGRVVSKSNGRGRQTVQYL